MLNYSFKIAILCLLLFCANKVHSQPKINQVEYYIDVDPGYGKATPVAIVQSTDLSNIKISLDPSTISAGVHLAGIRAKDANGAWSLDNKWVFVRTSPENSLSNIIYAEYYVDTDPGYDKAIPISISPATNISGKLQNIRIDTLSAGVHLIGIRAKDGNGAWSLDNKWLFVKPGAQNILSNIASVEYYVDRDPGYGKGFPIVISGLTNISDKMQNIKIDTLAAGAHLVGIRARDGNGSWSLDNKWLFIKEIPIGAIPNIVKVEYFIDKDPGYGKAKSYAFTPSTNLVDSLLKLDVSGISEGVHILIMRAEDANGTWSLDNKLQFIIPEGGALPIILSDFYGKKINNVNELTAKISLAINVKEVQIERSADGNTFSYIGTMASGTINAGTCKFDDSHPLAGNNFYRLRIIDNDGKSSYSFIIILNNSAGFAMQVYPNPVRDNLTLYFSNVLRGTYNIRVTDLLGQNVLLHKLNISQDNQSGSVNISFSRYAPGSYFIELSDDQNEILISQKIIKD